jgi:cytochrome c oxidase subunit 2
MAMKIVAVRPEEFDRWRQAQFAPAVAPTDEQRKRGFDVFMRRGRVLFYTIRGTLAGLKLGPDLTHLAGLTTIAAGHCPMYAGIWSPGFSTRRHSSRAPRCPQAQSNPEN